MTFGGLDSLFNPAKQHMEEEKLRLQSTREEIGDASGGKRIDLDSGRVKMAGRGETVDDADTEDDADNDDRAEAVPAGTSPSSGVESNATRRARERRSKAAQ